MNLTDSRLAQAGNERLELAMLSFFEQFRKIYIGDQVQKSSKVSPDAAAGEEGPVTLLVTGPRWWGPRWGQGAPLLSIMLTAAISLETQWWSGSC